MKYRFILIIFLVVYVNQAYPWITQLSPSNSELEANLQSDPESVLKQLLTKQAANDSILYGQQQLLLSQAYYALVFPNEALQYAQNGLQQVTLKSEPWLYHRLQISHSMALDISGHASDGLAAIMAALKWAEYYNDTDLIIESLLAKGNILISMVEYIQALESLQRAYTLAPNEGQYTKAEVAGIIALVYEYRKESELAIPFFTESVQYHRKHENWLELSIALYGLGRAHLYTSQIKIGKEELQESAKLSQKINDFQGEAYALKELAGLAMKELDFRKAEEMLIQSLETFERANNKFMQFDASKVLSELKLKTNDVDSAEYYLNQARKFINEEEQPIHSLALDKQQAEILAKKGELVKAYETLKKVMAIEKQLITKQSTNQLHRLRARYELSNKEKANQLLEKDLEIKNAKINLQNKQNKTLQILFLIAIILSVILLMLAYKLSKNKKHFQKLANYDGLTGLYTRARTIELLGNTFKHCKNDHLPFYLAMIDLDHFKQINDKFGHVVGDQVLKSIGELLQQNFTDNSICGRFGGEEFIVGISYISLNCAKEKLEKLRIETLNLSKRISDKEMSISLSAGLCILTDQINTDSMIKCADDALYRAKNNGRNQIIIG